MLVDGCFVHDAAAGQWTGGTVRIFVLALIVALMAISGLALTGCPSPCEGEDPGGGTGGCMVAPDAGH